MRRRKFPRRYGNACLLTVTHGEGEATLTRLIDELGPPEYPRSEASSLPVRLRQLAKAATIFAFETCGAPEVTLGPGVTLSWGPINRAHFVRDVPPGDKRIYRWRGHGRPPLLRGTWVDRAWQLRDSVQLQMMPPPDDDAPDETGGLLTTLGRAIAVPDAPAAAP